MKRAVCRAAALVVLAASIASGAVGDLDPSFGTGGVVVTQLGVGGAATSSAIDVAREPDGRLVVAGTAFDQLGRKALTLARYLPNGAFDTSFGPAGSGVVMTELGAGSMPFVQLFGDALALAPDGTIVVCGEASDAMNAFSLLVARYTPAGVLDASFGSGGKFTIQLNADGPSGGSGILGCTVLEDGRIVAAGYRNGAAGGTEAVVVRLDAHGMLDPGFGSGGIFVQQLALGSAAFSDATDVVALPDGSIVVSIEGKDVSNDNATGVARLTAAGMLDPGFATGGYSLVSVGGNSFASGVARLPDGRFVVAGTGADAMMNPALLAAAFTGNGAPDPSFGSSGHRLVQASAAATPRSGASGLVVQPSGRIVLVGEADDPLGGGQLALVRLGPDGMLDASFGGTGVVQRQLAAGSGAHTFGSGGVFTPDGKLVVCGYTFVDPVSTWFVASFVADLPPTATFGVAPAAPVAGDAVTLDASASTDPDGRVAAVAWDLDGDGVYGDATGAVVTTTFATGGPHVVGVAVSDDDGVTTTATQTLTVDCGTAATFASVGCRLLALAASVDGGVAPGKVHDRLAGDVASTLRSLDGAARASGKARRHALAAARRAIARFGAAVRDGGAATRAVRHQLLAAAKSIGAALGKLARAR